MNARLATGAPHRANLCRIGTRKRLTQTKSLYQADHDLRVKKTDRMNAATSGSANSRFVLLSSDSTWTRGGLNKKMWSFRVGSPEAVEARLRAHGAYDKIRIFLQNGNKIPLSFSFSKRDAANRNSWAGFRPVCC